MTRLPRDGRAYGVDVMRVDVIRSNRFEGLICVRVLKARYEYH